jgi:hypothetical protein
MISVSRPPPQRGRTPSSRLDTFFAAALTIGVEVFSKREGVTGLVSIRPATSLTMRRPVSLSRKCWRL